MKNFINLVKDKIKKNIKIDKIEIIDNSHRHKNHKLNVEKKFHLKIIIESVQLKSLSSIESQRKIMNILKDEFKDNIHSLEIKIN
tara:strand:- start:230 stop:484 length:255 start_codon:yes stop_codon:yes gene_type:complete